MQLGILGLRSVNGPPIVLYQRPPKGMIDGFFRGTKHGAVLGANVGWDVAKAFALAGPKTSDECMRTTDRGGECTYFILMAPIIGLLAGITILPTVTITSSIEAAFTAYSSAEVEK
jgi:hypothetical protein